MSQSTCEVGNSMYAGACLAASGARRRGAPSSAHGLGLEHDTPPNPNARPPDTAAPRGYIIFRSSLRVPGAAGAAAEADAASYVAVACSATLHPCSGCSGPPRSAMPLCCYAAVLSPDMADAP